MQTEMEPLLRRFTDPVLKGLERITESLAPHVEEVDGKTKLRYKMPDGMAKEDIDIEYQDGVLTVNTFHEQRTENMYVSRRITHSEMIGEVDPKSLKSKYANNTLFIEYTTPKKEEKVKIDVS